LSQLSIPEPLVLAFLFLLLIVFLITLRTLVRMLGRVVASAYGRTLGPIFRLIGRVLRTVFRVAGAAQAGRPVPIGATPYKALLHLLDLNSLARTELGEVPRSLRDLVARKGRLFRSVHANRAAEGLEKSLSHEAAEMNLKSAEKFYRMDMDYRINPTVLYEDSEEALIIGMLRDLDIAFFYVMRRISRNVSRNIVKVIALMTALVVAFPFTLSGLAKWLGPSDTSTQPLAYYITCAVFLAVLLWLRYTYSNAARYNGQQFNYFVQTYFSRLLAQYRSAETAFSNALNDRTSILGDIETNANLWFMSMHWLSARQWFLELYARNMTFQIGRNWLWTIALFPAFLFGVSLGLYYMLASDDISNFIGAHMHFQVTKLALDTSPWTTVPCLILLATYGFLLTNLLNRFWYEITPDGWPGFRTMDIKGTIEKNVGPLAREVVDRRRNPYGRGPSPF
jgi:hypothetical protein